MKTIELIKYSGAFAENKDIAKELRLNKIEPEIRNGNMVTIDFKGVDSGTQSFIHAMISQVIREFGVEVLDKLIFKNCNSKIKPVIEIVVEYVQDGIFIDPDEKLNDLIKSEKKKNISIKKKTK